MTEASAEHSQDQQFEPAERRMTTAIVFLQLFDDASANLPGRNQLLRSISASHPVVFLERTFLNRRLDRFMRPWVEQIEPNFFVMRNALSLRTHRAGRKMPRLAATIDGRWFRHALAVAGIENYIVWMSQPDGVLATDVPNAQLVYDCMDPNFLPEGQQEYDRVEFALARRAAVVFASAKTLKARMETVNDEVHLLPNAAAHLPAGAQVRPRPPALPTGPVAGYLGTIDWRFDVDHVVEAARALPDVTFAVVGRVNSDQETRIAPLRELPNIVLPGAVSNSLGDDYVASFDVGLIPFIPSEMNDAINPVKMYMYLAAGLPVVSTRIAECTDNSFVDAAKDPIEFAALIQRAITEQDPADRQARRDFGEHNTWAQRAESALRVLGNAGLVR